MMKTSPVQHRNRAIFVVRCLAMKAALAALLLLANLAAADTLLVVNKRDAILAFVDVEEGQAAARADLAPSTAGA